MYRGIATFTLDYGKCPPWLFERMVKLGREMVRVLIDEYGPDEFIRRIANPVWFQSLGTILAFDWNSSGLTTILTAALKEAIKGQEKDLGVFVCGGKGKTSRKTPEEIMTKAEQTALGPAEADKLIYNSKMAAKVDSALVQDGFQIYHHSFFFSRHGVWGVVQQGMNTENQTARRYHWFSEDIKNIVVEPHAGIVSDSRHQAVLDLTNRKSQETQEISKELVSAGYNSLMRDIQILRKHSSELSKMLAMKIQGEDITILKLENREFNYHPVIFEDFYKSRYLEKILAKLCAEKPENYEKLLVTAGVGPKTIRALALVAEIIYGARPSYEDPARYSFAHGGKDATPYPVDQPTYDQTIATMKELVRKSRLALKEKDEILFKLRKEKNY